MYSEIFVFSCFSHAGAVNGGIDLFEQVGKTADMILVSVGNDDTTELVGIAFHIGEVGQHDVHAGHFRIGESKTAVKNEHIIAALEHSHILADLVQTAQRNDTDGRAVLFTLLGVLHRSRFLCILRIVCILGMRCRILLGVVVSALLMTTVGRMTHSEFFSLGIALFVVVHVTSLYCDMQMNGHTPPHKNSFPRSYSMYGISVQWKANAEAAWDCGQCRSRRNGWSRGGMESVICSFGCSRRGRSSG